MFEATPPTATGRDRTAALEQVSHEVGRSGMRLDRFISLGSEGLLPDERLRQLWRQNRDVLAPDWAA